MAFGKKWRVAGVFVIALAAAGTLLLSEVGKPQSAYVQDVKAPTIKHNLRLLLAAAAVLAALAYAFYEWRQEITSKYVGTKTKVAAAIMRKRL